MNIVEVKPRIYFIRFNDQQSMCSTMLRIHEHSAIDHPFGTSIFTHKDYMDWYKNNPTNNKSSYDVDIQAICLYSKQFRSFIRRFGRNTMTSGELRFVESLKKILKKKLLRSSNKFAVVCTWHGEKSIDFNHEIAHAFYYIDKDYKKQVKSLFYEINKTARKEILGYLKILHPFGDRDYLINEANSRLSSENTMESAFGKNVIIKEDILIRFKEILNKKIGG